MKPLSAAVLAAALSLTGYASEQRTPIDQVTTDSGDWSTLNWTPGPNLGLYDMVHIEGGAVVDIGGGNLQAFGRLYIGDNSGGVSSADGTLNISAGRVTVNANAAGAFVIARADNSTGALNISGGLVRGMGNKSGAGMQVGFGAGSTGSITITGGELQLAGGVTLGYGDNSTAHFKISDGSVTAGNNEESGSFNIGGRIPGASVTATYEQTGGSVTVVNNAFRVAYAGSAKQMMNATASITGGTFAANVLVGRQGSLSSGGGTGGRLTIGHEADVSGQDQAWEVSGNGELIFELGPTASFRPVDLTRATSDFALIFSQSEARLTVNGAALKPGRYEPITLIKFAAGKGPDDQSKGNVVVNLEGFDKQFSPELVWTDTSLDLKLSK